MAEARALKIALLGCGTVGAGVLRLLEQHAESIATRVGARLEVAAVLVRDRNKERGQLPAVRLTEDVEEILADPAVAMVVEVMGGADAARRYVGRALAAGKGVVTANKMLLALHGAELHQAAAAAGVDLAFEAAVGGGIPIVRTLRDSLAGDSVRSLTGILNGTSNYVLTRMLEDGMSFDDAVATAQSLGYAEADPSMDVGGHDAAQKLQILARLAFGIDAPMAAIHVEGIDRISAEDHRFAERFGYCIKHLVVAKDHGEAVELRAHPSLVATSSVLANVSGVLNGVLIQGQALGPCLVTGQGAGAQPTAVSVVGDAVDVARSIVAKAAGLSTGSQQLRHRLVQPMGETSTRYYIRFRVSDRTGVVAHIAGALAAQGVSIEQMVQHEKPADEGMAATVVMLTHRAQEAGVQAAMAKLATAEFMLSKPSLIRIESLQSESPS